MFCRSGTGFSRGLARLVNFARCAPGPRKPPSVLRRFGAGRRGRRHVARRGGNGRSGAAQDRLGRLDRRDLDGVSVTLVTSATDPKAIEAGEAATASQYALSGGAVLCPKSKKNPGFHETPFAVFGFPGATLKLSHGAYAFSKTVVQPDTSTLGGTAKPFKLEGEDHRQRPQLDQDRRHGDPDRRSVQLEEALRYTAKLDPKLPVAPGQ